MDRLAALRQLDQEITAYGTRVDVHRLYAREWRYGKHVISWGGWSYNGSPEFIGVWEVKSVHGHVCYRYRIRLDFDTLEPLSFWHMARGEVLGWLYRREERLRDAVVIRSRLRRIPQIELDEYDQPYDLALSNYRYLRFAYFHQHKGLEFLAGLRG